MKPTAPDNYKEPVKSTEPAEGTTEATKPVIGETTTKNEATEAPETTEATEPTEATEATTEATQPSIPEETKAGIPLPEISI